MLLPRESAERASIATPAAKYSKGRHNLISLCATGFFWTEGLDLWVNQRLLANHVMRRVHVDKDTVRRTFSRMVDQGILRRRMLGDHRTIYALARSHQAKTAAPLTIMVSPGESKRFQCSCNRMYEVRCPSSVGRRALARVPVNDPPLLDGVVGNPS